MTTPQPVQVPEISTSSSSWMPFVETPVSPRRQALRPGSVESIELFAVWKLDKFSAVVISCTSNCVN